MDQVGALLHDGTAEPALQALWQAQSGDGRSFDARQQDARLQMLQGSLRCDSNVSLKPIGATEFGTRTETKNVNSLKSVEVAVRYEMR
ncbi:MAG: hypothetical protein JHC82_08880, partial [Stenotrophomonas sp.]|nr:hypothetical protein [Stenotrophomonas sp.]